MTRYRVLFAMIELSVTQQDYEDGDQDPAQTVQNVIGHTGAKVIAASNSYTETDPTVTTYTIVDSKQLED